jgi:putative endonuclease
MRTAAQRSGDAAEALAASHLTRLGWQVLARQIRVGRAEIDLLALDPEPPGALVVVEVRWRARRDFGLVEETVDARKRARLRRAAFALREVAELPDGQPLPRLPYRFDLIVAEPGGRLRHHRYGA